MPPRADARSFLPLTAAVFHILLALADDDRHGYGIAREVAEATRGDVHLGPGTLYDPRPGDDRRRYFRLTPLGREVAKAEAHRLAELLGLARGKSLISRSRS
jgi:DNA-binding PadR family transcriptional regulator